MSSTGISASTSWIVIIDTYKDDDAKASSGKKQVDPRFDLAVLDVETRGNYTTFVEPAVELDNNFSRPVVVDDFELADITWGVKISKEFLHSRRKNVVSAVNACS
jgi:hypothetical protein